MEWNTEIERTRQALMRYVFMLFSLATLAERAAFAPPAVRRAMLAALRPGAYCAQVYIFDLAQTVGATPDPAAPFNPFDSAVCDGFQGDSPDDAMLLSHCFRSLGWGLQFLLALASTTAKSGYPLKAAQQLARRSSPCETESPSARIVNTPLRQ